MGQINKLVEAQDYKGAMQIVDSIDWRRVKNVRTLCVVGEIYAANKRYEESKEIFLLAYHRATIGKNILYRLIEVSLKMGQISEATEFFDEYREVAGSDNSQYILRYKIARAKNASLNEQIRILEEYKEKEFTERWSYELAKLYYKAGDKQKCLDLCNEMILWFNDGTYVMKALDLKQRMGVLTGEEKEKYEQRFIPKLIPPEKAQEIRESKETEAVTETEYEESRPVTDTIQVDDERDLNSAETFQEKISKGIRDIFGGHKKAAEETEDVEEEQQDDTEETSETEAVEAAKDSADQESGEEETPEAETAATEEKSEEDASEEEAAETAEAGDGEELLASGIDNLSAGTVQLNARTQEPQDEEEEAYQEAEEAEAEKATEKELAESVSEIVEEDSVEEPKETSGVPLNEDGKPDFSATIRMPELKIPKSMINVDPENASSAAGIPDASGIFGSIDEIAAEVAKDKKADEEPEKEQEFNLEDTILAAASEQGINIPEEEKSPDVQQSEVTEETEDEEDLDIAADEFVPEEPDAADIEDIMAQISAQQAEDVSESAHRRIPDLVLDEDEEPVTEEDMQAAEAEFLNGPTGVQKPDTKDEFDGFDDLKEEEQLKEMPEDLSLEDEDISLEDESDDRRADKLTDDVVIPVEDETPLDEEEEFSDDDFGFKDEPEDDEEDDFISSLTEDMEEELSEEEQLERFIEDMQPEIDPNTIISRKRQLTDEEKQLFTYFVAVPGMKEQLVDVLCDVQKGAADKTSQTGNVIVMGGRETGKTRLISSLIPAICRELNIEASKVAYIFAEDLNGKNIAEIASKLAGGFLVIENANQLSQETADELDEVMNGNTKSMIVILEDEKIGMRKLIARYPKLAKKFTSMINIPVFTNDELVNFAKVYTMENGFRIDQMGMLALYNLIGINQKEDQPVCIGTVKTMLDNAMAKAQGGLFKRSKKRVDRDGFTVLLEKDFS
ncbi:tetratricopeptide repeat protein [Blautia sp.]|uniref:tetratricopeptide repeat protein n=1 Tax=Blautia sp. TaxID=1955243 RepID=UPI003AB7FA71